MMRAAGIQWIRRHQQCREVVTLSTQSPAAIELRSTDWRETVSNRGVRWIFAAAVLMGVIPLVRTLIRNARAIKRDMDQRFAALQARLEKDANSLADELLTKRPDQSQD